MRANALKKNYYKYTFLLHDFVDKNNKFILLHMDKNILKILLKNLTLLLRDSEEHKN